MLRFNPWLKTCCEITSLWIRFKLDRIGISDWSDKMIKIIKGNILEQKTEAIVNTVNCVGVMGRGIALSFREAYPENYRAYKKACDKGEVVPGRMFVHIAGDIFSKKYIIYFPTKRHWKGKSRIEDIQSGLADLVSVIKELRIKSGTIAPLW